MFGHSSLQGTCRDFDLSHFGAVGWLHRVIPEMAHDMTCIGQRLNDRNWDNMVINFEPRSETSRYSCNSHVSDLLWLMPCRLRRNIGHRTLVSIQLCFVLPPPYLYPAVHISFSRSLFQVLLCRPLPLRPWGFHCSTCLVMLSSFLLNMCPSQFHFLLRIWSSHFSTAVQIARSRFWWQWCNGLASDSWSKGRWFDSLPGRYQLN